ncbi:MAG: formyl transferase, partial [Acidobacteria bacterium]|nr:formyl transferase [Acidobacteriota bacterium]
MFPQILRQELLSLPGLLAVNYHPSPLPVHAGPKPT